MSIYTQQFPKMKTIAPIIVVLCLVAAEIGFSTATTRELTIGEATAFCEAEIPKYCIANTCPQFCATIRSPKAKASCATECKGDKRCKLRPHPTSSDDPKNSVLDAQNREQLWACIAEKRDPNNNKTGRNTTPWQEIRTPSYANAVRP